MDDPENSFTGRVVISLNLDFDGVDPTEVVATFHRQMKQMADRSLLHSSSHVTVEHYPSS